MNCEKRALFFGVCLFKITIGLCPSTTTATGYPGSATTCEVQVFITIHLRAADMTPAHHSPLVKLAFDASGTSLTTASEKVTAIREYFISEGQKLF